jgi:hypothetical protein
MPENPQDDFDELMRQADEGELTPEKVQEKLNNYHAAFEQEFAEAAEKSPDNIIEYTQDFFKKNVAMAAAQIANLCGNAESETVRANCSKFIIEQASKDATGDGDPFKKLFAELQANKKQPAKEQA